MALDINSTYRPEDLAGYVGGNVNETWNKKQFNYGGQQYEINDIGGGKRKLNLLNGGGNSSQPYSGYSFNPLDTARQIQQFQVEANQPAINTLQGQVPKLQDQYSKLLETIKGQGSVATNAQTLATSNELGRRGIMPSSGLGEQSIASALLPVTTQYANLEANTGLGQQKDLMDIANQIATLQRGDPTSAMSGATSIIGLQNQANQLAQQSSQFGVNSDLERQKLAADIANNQAQNAVERGRLGLAQQQFNYESNPKTLLDFLNNFGGGVNNSWNQVKNNFQSSTPRYSIVP